MAKRRMPPIVKALRDLLHQPFAGLVVRTADGEAYEVSHPDYILISPFNDMVFTYDDDGTPHHIAARHIVSIEPARPKKVPPSRRTQGRG